MPNRDPQTTPNEDESSWSLHDGHEVVLRSLGKTMFLVVRNRWINVSRIEDIELTPTGCRLTLLARSPVDLVCDQKDLADILEHGYED